MAMHVAVCWRAHWLIQTAPVCIVRDVDRDPCALPMGARTQRVLGDGAGTWRLGGWARISCPE